MSDTPPPHDVLSGTGWARLRQLIDDELTRRNIPRHIDEDTVHLLMPGGTPFVVALVPLARRLRNCDPQEWAELIARELDHQVTLDAGPPDIHAMTDPRAALKVQLRPRAYLSENPSMLWEPWWPGMLTVLMADHGEFARSLAPEELERFGEDREALNALARRNVARKPPDRMLLPGDREPIVMLIGDLFTTTHALWPGRYCDVDPDRGVLVGLPNRNCVLLVPVYRGLRTAAIEILAGLANMAFHNEAGPVTTSLYWTSGRDEDPDAIELPVTGDGQGQVSVQVPPPVTDRLK